MLSSIRPGCLAIIIGSGRADSPNIGKCVTCIRPVSIGDNVMPESIENGAWHVEGEGVYLLRSMSGWCKEGRGIIHPRYLMPINPDESFKHEEHHAKIYTN